MKHAVFSLTLPTPLQKIKKAKANKTNHNSKKFLYSSIGYKYACSRFRFDVEFTGGVICLHL